jgi:hypothetical protein
MVLPEELDASVIRNRARLLLDDRTYREAAQQTMDELERRQYRGADHVVELIEGLLKGFSMQKKHKEMAALCQ